MAIVAAAVALVVVLAVVFRGSGNGDFPDDDDLAEVVRMAHGMAEGAFAPVKAALGDAGDWLLAKGFSGYRVPAGLDGVAVTGGSVTNNDVTPVAVLLLDGGTKRAAIFPVARADLAVPKDGSWSVYELPAAKGSPRLAVAASVDNGVCFAVSAPGDAAALRSWLAGRVPGAR